MRAQDVARALACFLALAACDNASDDQAKADKAQATAADKISAANFEANQKVARAQAEADKKIAEAQASFMKLREDYRHDVATDLTDLDQKVAKLAARDETMSGPAKAELDARLTQIRMSRAAFTADFEALSNATALTWDDTKVRVAKEMSDLKTLVNRS